MTEGYRWAPKYAENTSRREPKFAPDPAELAKWTARNQHIADELARHPFITESHCETCGNRSSVNPCWRCAEETK